MLKMSDMKIEDTVILWDCSRSMVRAHKKTSRLRVAQKIIAHFIETKLSIDPKDSISVVIFGSRTKKLTDFSNYPDDLKESLKKFEIMGKTKLDDGIAFALQLLVKQIQKIGGKIYRIFVVTDISKYKLSDRLKKMAKLANGLGIFIDICQIGGKPVEEDKNVLKKIAKATRAEYAFFLNMKALIRGVEGFASKKITQESEDYFDPNKEKKIPKLITEVSVDLRRPSINEIREMMKSKVDYKCQICYQNQCPVCKSPFYACGRFCPSCGRPIHLHCASMWAERSDFPEKNVFRCPFCYFLLKIPKSVQKLMSVTGGQSIKIMDNEDLAGRPVKMVRIPDEEIVDIDDACSYCNTIFSPGEKVYQCNACNSYYHERCLSEMYNELKACRVCGGKIT
ncbi:MAG: VWA domain-containing protein [Candidatus Lokiarchaeota archaeon]|nr:VWA domain-containing protein [Candidatus Lokiarchaeota archaeon]